MFHLSHCCETNNKIVKDICPLASSVQSLEILNLVSVNYVLNKMSYESVNFQPKLNIMTVVFSSERVPYIPYNTKLPSKYIKAAFLPLFLWNWTQTNHILKYLTNLRLLFNPSALNHIKPYIYWQTSCYFYKDQRKKKIEGQTHFFTVIISEWKL